jgi:hypothetical protein
LSKKLDSKAPDGVVTEPSTVTTVPSGRLRAWPIEIASSEDWADAAAKASSAAKRKRRGRGERFMVVPFRETYR